jgi:hypothetical protein
VRRYCSTQCGPHTHTHTPCRTVCLVHLYEDNKPVSLRCAADRTPYYDPRLRLTDLWPWVRWDGHTRLSHRPVRKHTHALGDRRQSLQSVSQCRKLSVLYVTCTLRNYQQHTPGYAHLLLDNTWYICDEHARTHTPTHCHIYGLHSFSNCRHRQHTEQRARCVRVDTTTVCTPYVHVCTRTSILITAGDAWW